MKIVLYLLCLGFVAGCAPLNGASAHLSAEEKLAQRRFLTIYALSRDARCDEAQELANEERDPGMRLYYLGFTSENCEKDTEKAWGFYTDAARLGNSRAIEEFTDNGKALPPLEKK